MVSCVAPHDATRSSNANGSTVSYVAKCSERRRRQRDVVSFSSESCPNVEGSCVKFRMAHGVRAYPNRSVVATYDTSVSG